MREVIVRATWQSVHTIEVADDWPRIGSGALDELLDASGDDITSNVAELTDWEITDPGPSKNDDEG